MKINDIEVTIMDFERLNNIITRTLEEIDSGNLESAKQMLKVARDSIKENLVAESNLKQNIKIGDDVRITYIDSDLKRDFEGESLLGIECYVDVAEDYLCEGEYVLQPKKYKDLKVRDFIFTKKNLTLI